MENSDEARIMVIDFVRKILRLLVYTQIISLGVAFQFVDDEDSGIYLTKSTLPLTQRDSL